MMQVVEPSVVASNLAQRLRAVSHVLLTEPGPPAGDDASRDAGIVLDLLVRAVQTNPSPDRLWLLSTAVSGAYPTPEEVVAGVRFFRLAPPVEATLWLLDQTLASGVQSAVSGELRVVTDRVVADVDHSARHDMHIGIHQVVRKTLPLWDRDHPVLPVAWTDDRAAWRTLSGGERDRVMRWGTRSGGVGSADGSSPETIVPWRTVVVLPEVPPEDAWRRLAALAQYSGNAVVAIGHDCVPVVSADLVHPGEPQSFCRYLTVLKHARRIAGVSRSAAAEFGGFAATLPAQGLPGPTVVECVEPSRPMTAADPAPPGAAPASTDGTPLVLSVSGLAPRKNQLALLFAAERLWREGLDFKVLLIAGSWWAPETSAMIERLQDAGRPLELRTLATDEEVAAAYRAARFTVLTSLHEGYGLPVAESLASGTPVITTNYGSTAQIATTGGALLVDPRDDEAIVEAMRSLLTDDALLERLRLETLTRPERTWGDYAAELWDRLVEPALEAVGSTDRP
jgi:glycosyltransferase involved in cell wall biosynthesis